MITKRTLLDVTTSLSMEVDELRRQVEDLAEVVSGLKKKSKPIMTCACKKGSVPLKEKKTKTTAKRGPGRPRKNQ